MCVCKPFGVKRRVLESIKLSTPSQGGSIVRAFLLNGKLVFQRKT